MGRYILFFLSIFSSCFSLKLDRVILSTDNNPLYVEFWPIVAPIWDRMGLKPTLAFIADETVEIDESLGDVIRFEPLVDVPISLQAQAIRLLLPALFPDEGCILSDIDMIPILHEYFIENARGCSDDTFLVYRDGALGYNQLRYPMCYVAAKGKVFGDLFQIEDQAQIPEILHDWALRGYGWNTDELILFETVNDWERCGGRVIRLGHGVEGRLDRSNWSLDFNSLHIIKYIDCHCPRPYSQYKETIDQVVKQINYRLDHS